MQRIKSILFFSVGFLAIAIAFEFLLKYGGIMEPIVEIDQEKGQRYIANKTCCSLFINEGFGLANTNENGWFGTSMQTGSENSTSIAVLGNSYVAARQVFTRDNFLSLTENKYNAESKEKIILYNFGKESVTLQEALFIKQEVEQSGLKPHYYFVLVNENFFGTEGRYIPYYELINKQLKLNTDFKKSSFVRQYSKLKYIAESSLFFLLFRVKNRLPQAQEIILDKFAEPGIKEELSVGTTVDELDRTILEEFKKDEKVIFLLDLHEVRNKIVKSIIAPSKYIDLRLILTSYKQKTGVDPNFWPLSNVSGHWNRQGHNCVAEELTKQIKLLNIKQ